jgi:hypothetical protein
LTSIQLQEKLYGIDKSAITKGLLSPAAARTSLKEGNLSRGNKKEVLHVLQGCNRNKYDIDWFKC